MNAFTGLMGETVTPLGPPPLANTATIMTVSTSISRISATPRIRVLSRTSKCPRMPIKAKAAKARTGQGIDTWKNCLIVMLPKYENAPSSEPTMTA